MQPSQGEINSPAPNLAIVLLYSIRLFADTLPQQRPDIGRACRKLIAKIGSSAVTLSSSALVKADTRGFRKEKPEMRCFSPSL